MFYIPLVMELHMYIQCTVYVHVAVPGRNQNIIPLHSSTVSLCLKRKTSIKGGAHSRSEEIWLLDKST